MITTRPTPGQTAWFQHDRFGMFIHFGLYSMAARHEWVKNYEHLNDGDYDVYFKHFDPDLLDARQWARLAKAAGMKYAILTTKHHEGFCLFDSKFTDYKSTNTPYGKDIVREFVNAFRAEGLKIGFYYSLLDWHHPHFPIDWYHPQRNAPNVIEENKKRDMKIYAQYMRDQLTELMTNYGKLDILWFDFTYPQKPNFEDTDIRDREAFSSMKRNGPEQWESESLIQTVRALQPHIMINNRAEIEQDLWTPEQVPPMDWLRHPETGEPVVWEACHTFSGSWGYYRDELTWKSPEMLIQLLCNTVSCGGNLLMNVGPTGRGYLDNRAENALGAFGEWMKYNSRSIYGCTMAESEFVAPRGCRLTQSTDGKRLYIHIMEYPYKYLIMPEIAGKIEYAQFLHDGSEVKAIEKEAGKKAHGDLVLQLPENAVGFHIPAVKPDVIVPVIEVFLK